MIHLIAMLKRKSGTTHQEFLDYWFDIHAPLMQNSSSAGYFRRYEQHPASWPPVGSRMNEPDYDGVTIQEFDSVSDFMATMSEPDFPLIMADVEKFIESTQWVLTDVPRLVIDN